MRDFIAVTKSGTTYDVQDGLCVIEESNGNKYFFFAEYLKTVDRHDINLSWRTLHEQPTVDLPVVGQSIYIAGPDDWRLSTDVVSVVEVARP